MKSLTDHHRKAESQPIWILIGLLLAMIIGIMMYQMVARAGSQATFSDMMASIDDGTARIQVAEACTKWMESTWTMPPTNIQKVADYAAKLQIISSSEYAAHESISTCDCAMYLLAQRQITKSDVQMVYDPEMCHEWANTQAETMGIEEV